jgi:hypothetical protein
MANNYLETGAVEHTCFGEDDCSTMTGHIDESAAVPQDEGALTLSSHICPETGKVTMHATDDLRALFDKLRRGRGAPRTEVTSELMTRPVVCRDEVVMVDDEFHGLNGEYLSVDEVSDDGKVLTLLCYESGIAFKKAASAMHQDTWAHRLKVIRYGDPDVPPEWE